jgi:hypothetical protein
MRDLSARQVRASLVAAVYVLGGLWGLHAALTRDSASVQLGLSILFASTVALCCIADAKVVGKPMLISFQWLMFFTWPVSVPAYLVWTRRLRGLGLAVLHALLLAILSYATFLAACCLAYGPASVRAGGR